MKFWGQVLWLATVVVVVVASWSALPYDMAEPVFKWLLSWLLVGGGIAVAVSCLAAFLRARRDAPRRVFPYGHFHLSELETMFAQLVGSNDAKLVITVPSTSRFLQFTRGQNYLDVEYPVNTRAQRALENDVRNFFRERNLGFVIEDRHPEGNFLVVPFPPLASELATLSRDLFEDVFHCGGDCLLELSGSGLAGLDSGPTM